MAHKQASAFVTSLQNPFGDFLTKLTTPLWAAAANGSLTYDQAKAAQDSFNQQWTAFDTASKTFKSQGGDYAKVVNQAYDPNKAFMQTVNMVRDSLSGYVKNLQPASGQPNASDTTTPPDPNHPSGTGGKTAPEAARGAAIAQGKRDAAGTGFLSTILGGSISNTMNQRKTLLGY
jgi:hypothetical protein